MIILLLLVPLSLMLLSVALGAFVWAVKRGQFDDLDTPALDILVDDEPSPPAGASPAAASPSMAAVDGDARPGSDEDPRRDADAD